MSWQQDIYEAYQQKRQASAPPAPEPRIIQQSRKPPNQTEERFRLAYLEAWVRDGEIDRYGEHESIRFQIGNGVTLCPDWPAWKDGRLILFEVKGAFIREDATVKLKCFARAYPEHELWLYQWRGGEWISQKVLP